MLRIDFSVSAICEAIVIFHTDFYFRPVQSSYHLIYFIKQVGRMPDRVIRHVR